MSAMGGHGRGARAAVAAIAHSGDGLSLGETGERRGAREAADEFEKRVNSAVCSVRRRGGVRSGAMICCCRGARTACYLSSLWPTCSWRALTAMTKPQQL